MKAEIRLSGSGGQGIILAGIIIAEAAISMGYNAVQSQSYGPEARGGASKAEVIINKDEIFFTKVLKPDILLSLTQDSYEKYSKDILSDGIVVLDEGIKAKDMGCMVYSLPILRTASEVLKKPMVANIVALGALTELVEDLDRNAMENAIKARIPQGTEAINMRAFEEGIKMVQMSKRSSNDRIGNIKGA